MTARPVTNFIRQADRQTTDTRQTDRQNFYCIFLVLEVQNVEKKSFSSIGKKRILETSNICPSGLRTYNKQFSLMKRIKNTACDAITSSEKMPFLTGRDMAEHKGTHTTYTARGLKNNDRWLATGPLDHFISQPHGGCYRPRALIS